MIQILPFYFYLVHVIYYLQSNQNQSVYSFLFQIPTKIPSPNIFQIPTFVSGDLCVFYNVMLWYISLPGWCFPAFYGLHQKKKKLLLTMVPSFGKDTSLIFHFQEHTRSFNFLANALCRYCFPQVCRLWNRWFKVWICLCYQKV